MRYIIKNKGSKFTCEVQAAYRVGIGNDIMMYYYYAGVLRKDGSVRYRANIMYANSRRELIGKLKAKYPNLTKVDNFTYDSK